MIGSPSQFALPLPLLFDLRKRGRKPLYFLKFFIKWGIEKLYTLHVIYPYLCPPDCNGRYMDKHSGVMPLLLSNDSARVCRMACDMREWSVAMPLIEEMATQMDSSIWSTRQTYISYRYNNRAQKMLGYGRAALRGFSFVCPSAPCSTSIDEGHLCAAYFLMFQI